MAPSESEKAFEIYLPPREKYQFLLDHIDIEENNKSNPNFFKFKDKKTEEGQKRNSYVFEHSKKPKEKEEVKFRSKSSIEKPRSKSNSSIFCGWLDHSICERTTLWAKAKEEKINKKKNELISKTQRECTFEPKIMKGKGNCGNFLSYNVEILKKIQKEYQNVEGNAYWRRRMLKNKLEEFNKPLNFKDSRT